MDSDVSVRQNSCLLTEIDHIGIAVTDLEEAIAWYARVFGAKVAHRERIDKEAVEEALLRVADSYIQLLRPLSAASPVAKFLARRGPGIHHIGYRVTDCGAALAAAELAGARVIRREPQAGSRGTRVAFLHPATALGTLIELVEEPA
jgi:methylmalonyl-CoA/ethylmalonyl-CoA epimerase